MKTIIDKGKKIFKEEAYEHLDNLENSLVTLEENPDDKELIGHIFRAMHTIKGSAAMFGFDDITALAHDLETVFDLVRNGKIKIVKKLIDLTLSACDHIRTMLDTSDDQIKVIDKNKTENIKELLKTFISNIEKGDENIIQLAPSGSNACASADEAGGDKVAYWIHFRPRSNFLTNGKNPIPLLSELHEFGYCVAVAHVKAIPPLEEINPETCYTYWDVILTSRKSLNSIKDVFIFVEDECELKIEVIDKGENFNIGLDYKKFSKLLLEYDNLDIPKILKARQLSKKPFEKRNIDESCNIESISKIQHNISEKKEKQQKTKSITNIRVPSEKLDNFVNVVGELVTIQARLSQTALIKNDPKLISIAEVIERLTAELREIAMSIRMVPIGTIFSRFKRLARDISNELGKEFEIITDGAETELDKTVIERLNDPLVHLIRNSVDHGIEPPDVREGLGKPRRGNVYLSADHSGSNVLIQIKDDGAGLNKEAIVNKALEKGMITSNTELTDKEIFNLIFAPGFSTAQQITSVSGRGVGMDIVKRNIETLQGSIDINSQSGLGTTITLKLPLTLGIIEGLVVKIGDEYFIITLSAVEECVELISEDMVKPYGKHIANVRGEIVPFVRLREQFKIDGKSPASEQIVITQLNDYKIGLVVDQVIGKHQTVIKTMGRVFKDIEGISGATILGDGSVALILDVQKLVQIAETEEKKRLKASIA